MKAIDLENRYSARNYEPLPVVLARGKGAHLWDTSGRRYVDMMSAYSAASHGHGHPRILATLKELFSITPVWVQCSRTPSGSESLRRCRAVSLHLAEYGDLH